MRSELVNLNKRLLPTNENASENVRYVGGNDRRGEARRMAGVGVS